MARQGRSFVKPTLAGANTGTGGAPGIWTVGEINQLKVAGEWKAVVVPPPPGFTSAYDTLISTKSGAAASTYYINASTGNDSNNGTSTSTPWATVDKLQATIAATSSSSICAVIYPGQYSITTITSYSSSSAPFDDFGNTLDIICAPGQVDISFTGTTVRDCHFFSGKNTAAIYGAILKRDNNSKTTSYSTAIVGNTFATATRANGDWKAYNCVFEETNSNGNWSLLYDNNANAAFVFDYCTFAFNEVSSNDYSSSTLATVQNSVYNYSVGTTSTTQTNNETLASNDLDFSTYEGGSSRGVYSGTYAWASTVPVWRTANGL